MPMPHIPHPDCTCEQPPFFPTPWGPFPFDMKTLNTNKKFAQSFLINMMERCHTSSEAETLLDDWSEVITTLKTDILPKMYFGE